eukprot:gb/GECG01008049.1/.p1 GENE.gb/GECG01008049.1/~~gb/GECG01008049.1/.p1  ORF type:complete len:776 (+),score=67.80 gb/GECG01008049.1/:1-2328(+)
MDQNSRGKDGGPLGAGGETSRRGAGTEESQVTVAIEGQDGMTEPEGTHDTLRSLIEEREHYEMDHRTSLVKQLWKATKTYIPRLNLPSVLRDNYFTSKSWAETLASDAAAGFVVAVLLIPQGMAYAALANIDAKFGLISSAVAVLVFCLFGSSKHLAVGPTALMSLLTAEALHEFGIDPIAEPKRQILGATTLAFLVGLFTLILGIAKAGHLASFFSRPVLKSFTTSAAIVIASSQLNKLFGIPSRRSSAVYNIWIHVIENLENAQPETIYLAIESIALLLGLKYGKKHLLRYIERLPEVRQQRLLWLQRVGKTFPTPLVVVVVNILIVWGFSLDEDVKVVGKLDSGWVSRDDIFIGDIAHFTITMLPSVIVISILGFIESFSVAKTYALKSGDKLDADQELVGLGFANAVGGLLGAFPTTGGLSRTAVHADAGVKTQVSGLISGVLLLLVIFFLLPLFELLPEVTLASIIIVAITGMVDFSVPVRLWKINRSDFSAWCVTFLLTLLVGVEPGVLFGTLFSLLVVLKNASRPHWAVLGLLKSSSPDNPVYRNTKNYPYSTEEEPGVRILRFDSQLFFANSEYFVTNVTELGTHKIDWMDMQLEWLEPKVVAIDMGSVANIDYTSLQVLRELPATMKKVAVAERKRSIRRLNRLKEENASEEAKIDGLITTLQDFVNLQVPAIVLFTVRIPIIRGILSMKHALGESTKIDHVVLDSTAATSQDHIPYFVVASAENARMLIFMDHGLQTSLDLPQGMRILKKLLGIHFFDARKADVE